MNKTIVDIERIYVCIPKSNIAKSGFYNFESDAFNHSATLPTVKLTVTANRRVDYSSRFETKGKLIRRLL